MVVTYPPPSLPRTIGFVCCDCGATASTLVWRVDKYGRYGWYCLLCAPPPTPPPAIEQVSEQ